MHPSDRHQLLAQLDATEATIDELTEQLENPLCDCRRDDCETCDHLAELRVDLAQCHADRLRLTPTFPGLSREPAR